MKEAEEELPAIPLADVAEVCSVAVCLFRDDGTLLRANAAYEGLRAEAGLQHHASLLLHPRFSDLAAHPAEGEAWRVVHRGIMNVGAPGKVARSLLGVAMRAPGRVLVVAEPERSTYARLGEEVLKLNDELAELHRQQARDIAALRRTEAQLRDALAQVRTLRGLLPLCAHCHKIRNDEGRWERLETYVARHSEADFSHGICKDCLDEEMARLDASEGAG